MGILSTLQCSARQLTGTPESSYFSKIEGQPEERAWSLLGFFLSMCTGTSRFPGICQGFSQSLRKPHCLAFPCKLFLSLLFASTVFYVSVSHKVKQLHLKKKNLMLLGKRLLALSELWGKIKTAFKWCLQGNHQTGQMTFHWKWGFEATPALLCSLLWFSGFLFSVRLEAADCWLSRLPQSWKRGMGIGQIKSLQSLLPL